MAQNNADQKACKTQWPSHTQSHLLADMDQTHHDERDGRAGSDSVLLRLVNARNKKLKKVDIKLSGNFRTINIIFRMLQLASATIIAIITGYFLCKSDLGSWDLGRFIYTEVVAGISMCIAVLFLFPFVDTLPQIPVDVIVSLLWWTAFGLLFSVRKSS